MLATIEQSIVRPPTFDPTVDARRFSVVSSDYVAVTLLRPLLAELEGLATGLRLDATPVGSRFLDSLQRDELDLAVLPDRIVDDSRLVDCRSMPVLVDRFVGLVWADHPRAGDRLTGSSSPRRPT